MWSFASQIDLGTLSYQLIIGRMWMLCCENRGKEKKKKKNNHTPQRFMWFDNMLTSTKLL